MNYRDTLEYLYRLRLFGTKLGLENIEHLAVALGNPQNRLKFIHVAGTNGKGSVCAYLNSIYKKSGYKVGMFTSPHLVRFGERIQVNGKSIVDEHLIKLVTTVRNTLPELPDQISPTFFEFLTGMALKYFADEGCDLVIWETGMGGRLDATNIVTPECSIITNVSLDHQTWLGDTIEEIAHEKAGIIKPHKPVITAATQSKVLEKIKKKSKQCSAPLLQIRDDSMPDHLVPGLIGSHQERNAMTAIKAVEKLASDFPVSAIDLFEGIKHTKLPGRFQTLQWRNREVLLDVAHNLAGYDALAANCRSTFKDNPCDLIFASLDDKPWREGVELLLPYCKSVHCVPAKSQRSVSPQDLKNHLKQNKQPSTNAQIEAYDRLDDCFHQLNEPSKHPILITGSFYLVGNALSIIQDNDHNETSLNEWGAQL